MKETVISVPKSVVTWVKLTVPVKVPHLFILLFGGLSAHGPIVILPDLEPDVAFAHFGVFMFFSKVFIYVWNVGGTLVVTKVPSMHCKHSVAERI